MYVGVDLGGSKIAAAVVNEDGEILKRAHFPTLAKEGAETIVGNIMKACSVLLDDADVPPKSIGIGAPGLIRGDVGTVVFSPNLPLRNVDMIRQLGMKYNCDIHLANDANCAVLGEAVAGCGRGAKNVAMITLGTGLGGGLVIDGKLLSGISGAGGEVGHMVTKAGGRKCGCGRFGCWETYASATGLVTTALEFMSNHPDSLMWELCVGLTERVDGRTVFDAYRADDPAAILAVNTYIEDLATGIVNLINIMEPEIFCIGGGVSNAWDCMEEPLTAAVAVEKFARFSVDAPQTKLLKAVLGNEAGIIGAALLGRN